MLERFACFASLVALSTVAVAACTAEPEAKDEAVDETTQDFSVRDTRIAGTLSYGETSPKTLYRNGWRAHYVAYEFSGGEGDEVDVWVRSQGGDPVTWILDHDWRVVAKNDDASPGNTDSHVVARLPKSASAKHYVVVRDYWLDTMTFEVSLAGTSVAPAGSCEVDADCAKIEKGCCALGDFIAVAADEVADYRAGLACPQPVFCPAIAVVDDHSMAQCNFATKKCELVKPKDIACGGFTLNPHACPAGYACRGDAMIADAPGKCVQTCGGIAARPCTDPTEECVDDPNDACDPNDGGADCGGICQPKAPPPADCRTTGCDAGQYCSLCWGSFACIPNGAMC